MYVRMCVCMYVYMYVQYVCMYVCMYVCVYMYVYVFMQVFLLESRRWKGCCSQFVVLSVYQLEKSTKVFILGIDVGDITEVHLFICPRSRIRKYFLHSIPLMLFVLEVNCELCIYIDMYW